MIPAATVSTPADPNAPRIPASSPAEALRAGPALDAITHSALRRRAVLDGCKWDPQVGDVSTLAPFPLVMKTAGWRQIAGLAERLDAEAVAAEEEISRRPGLLEHLGLPFALRQVLAGAAPATPAAGRVVRFDFHLTTEGWRISEANSDVPGGFSEASCFTALMAEHFPGCRPAGDPAAAWSEALAAAAGPGGTVALLSAAGYMEDHQVVAFLATRLRERGCSALLAGPGQILWRDGAAHLNTPWHRGPLNVLVRFYQAEWISRRPPTGWQNFFRGGRTPVANPPFAIVTESKRFPLTWDRLATALPVWRALLPETHDPRDAPWRKDDGWLLKTALCNTGDTVSVRALMRPGDWLRTRFFVRLQPGQWVAQRRFESVPIATPVGPRHVCVGVYTINGRAAGAYTRLSERPVIDFAATDAALLLEDDDE